MFSINEDILILNQMKTLRTVWPPHHMIALFLVKTQLVCYTLNLHGSQNKQERTDFSSHQPRGHSVLPCNWLLPYSPGGCSAP